MEAFLFCSFLTHSGCYFLPSLVESKRGSLQEYQGKFIGYHALERENGILLCLMVFLFWTTVGLLDYKLQNRQRSYLDHLLIALKTRQDLWNH